MPDEQFFSYMMARTSDFFWDDNACLFCTRLTHWIHQFTGRPVSPLGYIILFLNQPFFTLTPKCCMVCGEATTTKIFDLTRPGLEPTIYHTITLSMLFKFDRNMYLIYFRQNLHAL